jgi:antitoxin VapB
MPAIETRTVKLFRNGADQVLSIPSEFELPGDTVVIRKHGDRLVVEPAKRASLLDVINEWQPIDDEFPDINDDDLPPLDEVRF